MSPLAEKICLALKHNRLSFYNETRLHDAIKLVLDGEKIVYSHEHVLNAKDRIDFYIPSEKIGIEAKIKGSLSVTLRQLSRYCDCQQINELIVVTSRLGHRFPEELCGKPVVTCKIIRSLC